MKPLYLHGDEPVNVTLDGPALRIERPARSTVLIPLARVSRVVAGGQVTWGTAALLACADQGVPVTFLARDGGVRARWIGTGRSRCTLKRFIEDFLDRPDWRARYGTWIAGVEQQAALRTARRMRQPIHPPLCVQAVKQGIRLATGEYAASSLVEDLILLQDGLLRAHVRTLLAARGIDDSFRLAAASAIDLENDITRVLDWELDLLRAGWLRRRALWIRKHRRHGEPPSHREMVKLYETRSGRIERSGEALLGRLHRWLSEVV